MLVGLMGLLTSRTANAGAWGADSFDNDGALDWLGDFLDQPSPAAVAAALNAVLRPGSIDEFDGESAIAAAEIVAASLGKPTLKPNKELTTWLQAADVADYKKLRGLAVRAVKAVILSEKSELRNSWSLHRDDLDTWTTNGVNLLKRLGDNSAPLQVR